MWGPAGAEPSKRRAKRPGCSDSTQPRRQTQQADYRRGFALPGGAPDVADRWGRWAIAPDQPRRDRTGPSREGQHSNPPHSSAIQVLCAIRLGSPLVRSLCPSVPQKSVRFSRWIWSGRRQGAGRRRWIPSPTAHVRTISFFRTSAYLLADRHRVTIRDIYRHIGIDTLPWNAVQLDTFKNRPWDLLVGPHSSAATKS